MIIMISSDGWKNITIARSSHAASVISGMIAWIRNIHIRKQHVAGIKSKHIMMITAAMQSC